MTNPPLSRLVLTLSCANHPGIVADVATLLFEHGGDIREAQQFDDRQSDRFFMRTVFDIPADSAPRLRDNFAHLAQRWGMDWKINDQSRLRKVMLLVSKFDHCLMDLLYRHRIGELAMEIVGVISNHPAEPHWLAALETIPFHHLPVAKSSKMEQEAEIWRLVQQSGAELVVLARYMQVLSDALAAKLAGRCINIHHSFLPSFKGARPYHPAHDRGVKLIGATAHFVTADLDEGPIIEQDVERISHNDSADDLVRKGRDIERRVLARALRAHLEDRIILNGRKAVVFND